MPDTETLSCRLMHHCLLLATKSTPLHLSTLGRKVFLMVSCVLYLTGQNRRTSSVGSLRKNHFIQIVGQCAQCMATAGGKGPKRDGSGARGAQTSQSQ